MTTYKKPVCRGSWLIGNNCKTCERCIETKRWEHSYDDRIEEPRAMVSEVAALVEAAKAVLHAVCHETGFAAAVRADSGLAYPWEPLEIAEAQLRQALAPFGGQTDAK